MEHTHNYDDGSEQMPFPFAGLDDMIRQPPSAEYADTIEIARDKLVTTLTDLRASNKRKFEEMVAMGVQPAPTAIVMARIEQLVDMLFDDDTRIGFDLGFEARMAAILDDGVREGRRQQIMGQLPMGPPNGNGRPPGLILP